MAEFNLIIKRDLYDRLEGLPGDVLDELSEALHQRLAISPSTHRKQSEYPFAPDHQVFTWAVFRAGQRYLFRISFKYGQDEE
jgi:hypothetical protein